MAERSFIDGLFEGFRRALMERLRGVPVVVREPVTIKIGGYKFWIYVDGKLKPARLP
jgi:hypothetical protein